MPNPTTTAVILLQKREDKKHSVLFDEAATPGVPPVVRNLYVSKAVAVPAVVALRVTLRVGEPGAVPEGAIRILLRKREDKKHSVLFAEVPQAGGPEVLKSVYVSKVLATSDVTVITADLETP